MSACKYLLVCLIYYIPGPPVARVDEAYFQLIPLKRNNSDLIDPVRDIQFQLFSSRNPLVQDVLKTGDDKALEKSHLNFSEPTILFFHAYFESSQGNTATMIKTAYLQRGDHNIILMNAQRILAAPWYSTAAKNSQVIGEYTARFVDYLVSKGLHLPSLHLVGLSLGAHIAGICATKIKSGRVRRITGLDPSGPIFIKWPKSMKLDRDDAEFVDVIHTSSGDLGYPEPIGHVDFWPNQGISPQPGCDLEDVKKRDPDAVIERVYCSHWRAYQFYAESVLNEHGFLAIACNSWKEFLLGHCPYQTPINMGFAAPFGVTGNYYLTTRPTTPFSFQ